MESKFPSILPMTTVNPCSNLDPFQPRGNAMQHIQPTSPIYITTNSAERLDIMHDMDYMQTWRLLGLDISRGSIKDPLITYKKIGKHFLDRLYLKG